MHPTTITSILHPTLLTITQHLDIHHRRLALLHTRNRLLERLVQRLCIVDARRKQVAACGGLGNARVVGDGVERDVDFLVGGFGAEAVWVDEQEGSAGGVPACWFFFCWCCG